MNQIVIDGNRLVYEERGQGEHAIVFLHGWTCNRSHFAAQMAALSHAYRVIAVDLRGHGESGAPQGEYTLERFSTDIFHLCEALNLHKPLLVGHSMGGMVALETAERYPDLPSGIVLIDSVVLPAPEVQEALQDMYRELANDLSRAVDGAAGFLEIPNSPLGFEITRGMKSTRHEVAISAFRHHILDYDAAAAIAACRVPASYIRSVNGMASLEHLQQIWNGLRVAQTLGSGHFSMLEVPDQINAMIRRFCHLLWGEEEKTRPETLSTAKIPHMIWMPPWNEV